MKTCINCKIEKEESEFKTGRKPCKDCLKKYQNSYNRKYYIENKEKIIEQVKEYSKNNDDKKFYMKEYYHKNKEKNKQYRELNKDRYRELRKKYRESKKSDPLYQISLRVRKLISKVIKRNGYSKKSKTQEILGIDFDVFKLYIENLFTDGMNWENFGKWHLDHKIPISWGENEDDIIKLNHYTNLQPLWAEDNLSKGNKYSS
jgi:hypothetical protein